MCGVISDAVSGLQDAIGDFGEKIATPAMETADPFMHAAALGMAGAGLGTLFGGTAGLTGGPNLSDIATDSFAESFPSEMASASSGSSLGGYGEMASSPYANMPSGFGSDVTSMGSNLPSAASTGGGGLGGLMKTMTTPINGMLSPLQIGSGLYDMYAKNRVASKQQDYIDSVRNQINGSYAVGSPEYNLMKQEMERKDAAAGRNSQYGQRAVDLAAKVNATRANTLAQTLGPLGNLQNTQAQNQYSGLNSLFGYATQAARMKQLQDMVGKNSGSTYPYGG